MKQYRKRQISPEFKTEAIRLMNEGDVEIWIFAMYMNVAESTLRRWKRKVEEEGNNAFKDKDVPNKAYSFLYGSAEDAQFWYQLGQSKRAYMTMMYEMELKLLNATRLVS